MQLDTTTRNALLQAFRDAINSGTLPVIEVYTGSRPTNTTDPDTGTKLATCTMNGTDAFAAPSGGSMAAAAIAADPLGDATGTPGYFSVKVDAGGTVKARGTCGVTSLATTGELQFDQPVSLGGNVSISSFVLTAGNA